MEMRWGHKVQGSESWPQPQKYGCSFFKDNDSTSRLFLSKKVASTPIQKEATKIGQQKQVKSSKQFSKNKISLKGHKQTIKTMPSSGFSSLMESKLLEKAWSNSGNLPKRPQFSTPTHKFPSFCLSNPQDWKVTNNLQPEQKHYQYFSQKTIKYLKFQEKAKPLVIKFVRHNTIGYCSPQSQIICQSQPNLKNTKICSEIQLQTIWASEKEQKTNVPSQVGSKTQFHSTKKTEMGNHEHSTFQLPPKLDFQQGDCEDTDHQIGEQKAVFPKTCPQIMKSSDQLVSKLPPSKVISQSTQSHSKANSSNQSSSLLFKSAEKPRTVQKMEDVAQIVSLCDSNASNDGEDESIVLGRLQEFENMRSRLPKPENNRYEKSLSECDSIVIFQ